MLIDEAQDLDYSVLEELRLLSNLETAKEKILQIVLAGQPELGRSWRARSCASSASASRFRRDCVRCGGPKWRRTSRPACARPAATLGCSPVWRSTVVWRFSRGVPRLLNVACDNALLSAYAAGAERVGWRIMGEAVHDLRAAARPEPHAWRWRMRFGTVLAAALVGSITGIVGSRLLGLSFSRPAAPPPLASVPAAPTEASRDPAGSRALQEPPPVEAKATARASMSRDEGS